MKAGFMLPSCNYNIVLSKEDIQKLLEIGSICVRPGKDVPCKAARTYYDEEHGFNVVGERDVCNDLSFYLDGELEDCGNKDWPVQFLTINVDEKDIDVCTDERTVALSVLKDLSGRMRVGHNMFGEKELCINVHAFEAIRKKYLDKHKEVKDE